MNSINNFRKLEIYTRSLKLACEIIQITDDIRPFRLGEQLAGSCISVPSNIAEGSVKYSTRDFIRYLEYASGSIAELQTQLYILKAKNILVSSKIEAWVKEAESIASMIHMLIQLKKKSI
ncbi:MAG: four helix bundle protein [Bacteroidetes bacterium]|nr:four helix bundle protein [Bacteroidota bacterium]